MGSRSVKIALPCLLLALTGLAPDPGGWVVITLEDLPDHLVAGTPVELTYTVRQHGQTLRGGLEGTIIASAGDRTVEVSARPGDRVGEYRAELTVPETGLWTVAVRSQIIPGHRQLTQTAELLPIEAVEEGEEPRRVSEAETGRRLFVAKGCVTCHTHRAAGQEAGVGHAPDLTSRHYVDDDLAMYLADPSIRPSTTTFPMPNLDLDGAEIAGLTAFLNAEEDALAGSGR